MHANKTPLSEQQYQREAGEPLLNNPKKAGGGSDLMAGAGRSRADPQALRGATQSPLSEMLRQPMLLSLPCWSDYPKLPSAAAADLADGHSEQPQCKAQRLDRARIRDAVCAQILLDRSLGA